MKKKHSLFIYLFVICILFVSCDKKNNIIFKHSCNYPDSKIWKHGVYSKYDAQNYEGVFDGLEVDVIYSPEKDNIYVGRVVADTSKRQTLDEWLSMLKEPNKTYYWIDFKNLSKQNAEQSIKILDDLNMKYGFKENAFVESQDLDALKIAKQYDFLTILWVDNIHYWRRQTRQDTISVVKTIRNKINKLQPDAISCEFTMYPLLCDSFPEQNIHFWDTPKDFTPENVEFTKRLCGNESVKVVLVDYPTPEIF